MHKNPDLKSFETHYKIPIDLIGLGQISNY